MVQARSDGIPKIYFIQVGEMGPIKIGFAHKKTVWTRMTELQTGNPEKLNMLFFMPGTMEQEKQLHQQFKHLRIRGEWFRPAPELLLLVRDLKK